MSKVLVVYESKHGNTKLVAERIVEGVEVFVSVAKEIDFDAFHSYDGIVIGSPNHIGGPTRGVKKLIDKLGKLKLGEKGGAVFDTYLEEGFNKAVKKMEKRIAEKAACGRTASAWAVRRGYGNEGTSSQKKSFPNAAGLDTRWLLG